MLDDRNVQGEHPLFCLHRLSWSAIIQGALVATGLGFLINLFGVSIGLSAFTAAPEGSPTLALGGFFALLIGTMITMFVGGLVAGFLGRKSNHECLGLLYGFLTWCVALIISTLLISQLADFTSRQYNTFTNSNVEVSHANPNTPAPVFSERSNTQEESEPSKNRVVMNNDKMVKTFSKASFLLFLLFFGGALASTYGGHVGMKRE